jgi:hypothetical protein
MISSFKAVVERLREHGTRWCAEFYFYRIFRSRPGLLKLAHFVGLFKSPLNVPGGFEALQLDTYVGVPQTTHPTILRYRGRLILALTPYPYSDCFHENPCVYESLDGLSFSPLSTAWPLDARAGAYLNYLSDPNLSISRDEELVLRYRETINAGDGSESTRIWESRTKDLATWSAPVELLENTRASVISPATRSIADVEYLYFVALQAGSGTIRRSRIDEFSAGLGQRAVVAGLPDGCHPWHLDFFSCGGADYMLLTSAVNGAGGESRLFLCVQTDSSGLTYSVLREISPQPGLLGKGACAYKAAGLPIGDDSVMVYLSLIFPDSKVFSYRYQLHL